MADYDSDSSGADDIETNVVLGYASKEPTDEPFSQLGGHPTWLGGETAPSGTLAKCKTCNGLMNLLLQIRGDLDDFPTHERRLYVWACRRKACRRKAGSIRAFRAMRQSDPVQNAPADAAIPVVEDTSTPTKPATNLGETLFGVKSTTSGPANPFSTSNNSGASSNPFATTSSSATTSPQNLSAAETLPQTFAQKVRIHTPEAPAQPTLQTPHEPWPAQAAFPRPYPSYYVDPDKEYIDPEPAQEPNSIRIDRDSGDGSGSSAEDKAAFESSMDKTFQKFADRLAQNPEQVLRYEYGGQPLLYCKTDAVGRMLSPAQENAKVKTVGGTGRSKMPRCTNCGAERVFQLQLTPHAIAELEADEMSVEGMDWGTVILGVCSRDCQEKDKQEGEVGYVEEWVGVQWEELAGSKRPA